MYEQTVLRLLHENSVAKTMIQGQNEYVKNNTFKYKTAWWWWW